MKKLLSGLISISLFLTLVTFVRADKPADVGFNEFGYNYNARVFNGTGYQWCMGKYGWDVAACDSYLGIYAGDKLVMKWNEEWDRGNAEGWSNGPYRAWTSNEWNGMDGGSDAVWHYKIVWDEGCAENGSPTAKGNAYCIWGQFATVMDQGKDPSYGPGHFWFAHGTPSGYGAYGR